jgi:hypothetical protein
LGKKISSYRGEMEIERNKREEEKRKDENINSLRGNLERNAKDSKKEERMRQKRPPLETSPPRLNP